MQNKVNRFLERLLTVFIKERDREALLSDFEEIYLGIAEERGKSAANSWYVSQILRSIPPALFNKLYWFGLMFKNYCIIAFRKYTRQRAMTLINVSGLAIGMAAFLIIELYISYEKSYDSFHDQSRNIYRIQHNFYKEGELKLGSALTVPAVPAAIQNNFSELRDYALATRAYLEYAAFSYSEDVSFRAERIFFVTPSFINMFDFALIQGDPQKALSGPLQAVLTRSTAQANFGDEDPLGKTIVYNDRHAFTVTGVCEDVPTNSHIQFDVLLSFDSIAAAAGGLENALKSPESDWSSRSFYAYLSLYPEADPKQLQDNFNKWLADTRSQVWKKENQRQEILLQPLEDIHLFSNLAYEIEPESQGNAEAVRVLSIIAVFILVLAWVNYINITTSRALERAREVGIRKVSGAYRLQLVKQFLFEYLGLNLFAALLALILVVSFIPYFSQLTSAALSFRFLLLSDSLRKFIWIFLLGTFLSGFYPAVLLSAFKPSAVLKGHLMRRVGGVRLRKVLVTLQLTVSVALIAGTLIVFQQLTFMLDRDPGIDVEQILVLHCPGTNMPPPEVFNKNFTAFREDAKNVPDVLSFSSTTAVPGEQVLWSHVFRKKEDSDQDYHRINLVGIDDNFIPTLGIRIIAGRNFSQEFPSDENSMILNDAARSLLGFRNAEEAINRAVIWRGRELPVVGVIENYNQLSPKAMPIPLIYLHSGNRGFVAVKINTQNLYQTLGQLKSTWQRHFPGIPFDYFFLDEFFNRHFEDEQRFSRVFALFAALTIFIACLGLFALASHNAVQRTKEIGIRKAVGASVRDIYLLLSREFLRLVVAAGIIAVPFTYLQMQDWLANYTFRIPLQWWFFAAAWAVVAVVVLITISFQTMKAAVADPVDALRYE
jgi:putative ABC transport system permease protein